MSNTYCNRCCRQFGSSMALWQHENNSSVHQSLVWICKFCGEGFQREDWLIDHRESEHRIACDVCDRQFNDWNELKEHSKVHLPRDIECTHCNMEFTLRGGLFLHLEEGCSHFNRDDLYRAANEMDDFRLFTFDNMPEYFSSNGRNYYRDSDGDWRCGVCNQWFRQPRGVIQHLRSMVHGEKWFYCGGCDHEFANLSGLAMHIESESCGWNKGLDILDDLIHGLRTGKRFTIDR